jgi:hypothetical protein
MLKVSHVNFSSNMVTSVIILLADTYTTDQAADVRVKSIKGVFKQRCSDSERAEISSISSADASYMKLTADRAGICIWGSYSPLNLNLYASAMNSSVFLKNLKW